MGRTKTYNETQVRQNIVQVFLQKGYAATSLVDLEQGSGLNRRQLYNDFGDKQTVFVESLSHFAEEAGRQFLRQLEQGSDGVEDIRQTLQGLLGKVNTPRGRLGCLICNTASEPICENEPVNSVVQDYFQRIEKAYLKALRRAKAAGELRADDSVTRLARFLLSLHVSLCILARAGTPAKSLRDAVGEGLKRLD